MTPEAYIEMDNIESTHWWFCARRFILKNILKKLELPKDAKILEIGCGTGGNLDMLGRFGEVSALEMDENAISIASNKTNYAYNIKSGYCPQELPFEKNEFDLICMFDVLEHIEADKKSLFELKKLLKEDGKMLITVPAYNWLFGSHDKFLHHKRRYSKTTLKTSIPDELEILNISYFNTFLFPIAAIVRLKEKLFKSDLISTTAIPSSYLNKILKSIFASERYFLNYINLPFGLSLYCVLGNSKNSKSK